MRTDAFEVSGKLSRRRQRDGDVDQMIESLPRLVVAAICLLFGLTQSVEAQQTSVFTVAGQVVLEPGENWPEPPDTVSVGNATTGVVLRSPVQDGATGSYGVVFVDVVGNRAAAVGDLIQVALETADGEILAEMPDRLVDLNEIESQLMVQPVPRFTGETSFVFGRVLSEGMPVVGEEVAVKNVLLNDVQAVTRTDAAGYFLAGGFLAGGYIVSCQPAGETSLVGEYFDNVAFFDPLNEMEAEVLWLLAPELRAGIDFDLEIGGTFSGVAVDALDGSPLVPVSVSVVTLAGRVLRSIATVGTGEFVSIALPDGVYGAAVLGVPGYADQYFELASSIGDATPIEVSSGNQVTGIHFALGRSPVAVAPPDHQGHLGKVGEPYPNPLRGSTRIPVLGELHGARVLDVLGRWVVDIHAASGMPYVSWDGLDARGARVPRGAYFLEVRVASEVFRRRVVVID